MQFRKKPVVVDAVQWFPPGDKRWPGPIPEVSIFVAGLNDPFGRRQGQFAHAEISTLEGTLKIQSGDWIITGVEGEKYACKPGIFEKTYEPA